MGYFAASIDMPLDKQIANAAAAGRVFTASATQFAATAGGPNQAISLFWTARTSKIAIFSAKAYNNSAGYVIRLHKTTSDPALSGHSIGTLAIINSLGGAGAATSGAALSSTTEAASTATGTLYRGAAGSSTAVSDIGDLLRPDYIIFPPNVAGGVLLMINGASTNNVNLELSWAEIF